MNLPAWDIESEYPSLNSAEFQKDENRVEGLIAEIEKAAGILRSRLDPKSKNPELIGEVQKALGSDQEALLLLGNLMTYATCLVSTDATNGTAQAQLSRLYSLRSRLSQAFKPFLLFMISCNAENFEEIVSAPDLQGTRFSWLQKRTLQNTMLSEKEEILLAALETSGHQAWGNLYKSISGTMKVRIELNGKTEEVGLAQASGMTRSPGEIERKSAWLGIQEAWKSHQESAASILNSLADWRLQLAEKRSHSRKVDFLTMPLLQNRIQKDTLDALFTAVQNNKKEIQQAVLLMARVHGKSKLDPWDLLAPAPVKESIGKIPFDHGLDIIRTAFAGANPKFGEFVQKMIENRWIEARVLPHKSNGAYCTDFKKSRTPRVFQTYMGSTQDVSTLAHELGHAYHSWVVRDLPHGEQNYPMTLAETASIFAETVLADELIRKAQTREQKIEFYWSEVEGAVSLLLNIPARYEFELEFYTLRKKKQLGPTELSELMDRAWTNWYGDTLTENDKMFWASKLHFSMAGLSFYNFPYTFGYLFGLSIYARRDELGSAFWPKYVEILRDTGRMTCEDLVLKHFREDIRNPEFWQKSIDVVKGQIQNFKDLL